MKAKIGKRSRITNVGYVMIIQDTTERESDPLETEQGIESWPDYQMVYAQPRICPEEWDVLNSLRFWDKNRFPNSSQKTRSLDS